VRATKGDEMMWGRESSLDEHIVQPHLALELDGRGHAREAGAHDNPVLRGQRRPWRGEERASDPAYAV